MPLRPLWPVAQPARARLCKAICGLCTNHPATAETERIAAMPKAPDTILKNGTWSGFWVAMAMLAYLLGAMPAVIIWAVHVEQPACVGKGE